MCGEVRTFSALPDSSVFFPSTFCTSAVDAACQHDTGMKSGQVQCDARNYLALHGAGTWTLHTVHQTHIECFKMCCWRRMLKISWNDRVKNGEVLQRIRRKGTSYIQENEEKTTGLVTPGVETAYEVILLKERQRE